MKFTKINISIFFISILIIAFISYRAFKLYESENLRMGVTNVYIACDYVEKLTTCSDFMERFSQSVTYSERVICTEKDEIIIFESKYKTSKGVGVFCERKIGEETPCACAVEQRSP